MGIFALDPRPPFPPRSPPSRIPVTFQHGWFPPVGKIFPSKNAVALYYYGKEFAPSGPRPPPSEFPLPSFGGKIWIFLELGIHHFHRGHKAPYLPPKFCITIVFDSFREDHNTQENWKQWLICKSFGRCTMYGLGDWNGELEKKNKKKNLVLLCPSICYPCFIIFRTFDLPDVRVKWTAIEASAAGWLLEIILDSARKCSCTKRDVIPMH